MYIMQFFRAYFMSFLAPTTSESYSSHSLYLVVKTVIIDIHNIVDKLIIFCSCKSVYFSEKTYCTYAAHEVILYDTLIGGG